MTRFTPLALALLALGSVSYAGQVAKHEVVVGTTYAYGAVSSARYSADNTQSIRCGKENFNGSASVGFCMAVDRGADEIMCVTTDREQIRTIEGMTEFTDIYFQTYDGSCDFISMTHSSGYLP